MASEFATQLAHVVQGVSVRGAIREADAELTEVRAVLSLTADRRYPYPIDGHGHCWCTKDLTDDKEPHGEFCQRARALYERLKP